MTPSRSGRSRPAAPTPTAPSKRVTIHDVAEALQVSTSTVSLALNGKGTIAPATRDRVIAEAARLGYSAHPFARGLRDGRSGVLGLSVRSLDEYGTYRPAGVDHFTRMAGAAAFTALDQGFGLMLVPLRASAGAADGPLWVDGYIMEDPHADDPVLTRMLDAGVPVVTIGWDPARKSRTAWVSTSDRDAGYQLLDLLAGRGARRICYVGGTERNSWNLEAERAYRSWSRERQYPIHLLRIPEDEGEEGGARLAKDLLADSSDRPDAIYCQTGRHATGVARTAVEFGIRIPAELMVAAGSDTEPARSFDPPITAIDLQPETLGREAVDLLVGLIGGSRDRRRTIPARILERGSTRR